MVRPHWRSGCWVGDGGDFTSAQKLSIVHSLIRSGIAKEDLSLEYQGLWDEVTELIAKEKSEPVIPKIFPQGGKWITDALYEVDGEYYLVERC